MSSAPVSETVLSALRELGGYFVWRAEDGQEYVITSRQEFEARTRVARDLQLDLLERSKLEAMPARWTADDMLEKINRDLALYQLQHDEDIEALGVEEEDNGSLEPLPPSLPAAGDMPAGQAGKLGKPFDVAQGKGKRVRFEPLRGDLPPSLQE